MTAASGSGRPARGRAATELPLVVVGAGAAGTALARALASAGQPVERVACRTTERAAERARLVGAGRPVPIDGLAPSGPDPVLLLIGVPDRHLADQAAALARPSWPAGSVALHLSGSVEVETLAPLRGAGCAVGGLHPLKSFVDPERDAASLAGTVCAVEGDPPAVEAAEVLAQRCQARPFRLAPGSRPAWHAAAAHAANHLVALLDQALDLAASAGLDRDQARAALLPLMAGTLDNLAHHPPGQALTGPVVRGDVPVLSRHARALAGRDDDLPRTYRALAERALDLARHHRDLSPEDAAALAAVLETLPR